MRSDATLTPMTPELLQQFVDGTLPPGAYDVGPGINLSKLPPPSNGSSGRLATHPE